MAGKPNPERDEKIKLSGDPEAIFKALMQVDPNAKPASDDESEDAGKDSDANA